MIPVINALGIYAAASSRSWSQATVWAMPVARSRQRDNGVDNRPVSLNFGPTKQAGSVKAALKATKADKNVYTFGYRGLIDDSNTPSTYKGLLDTDRTKRAAFAAFKNG